MNYPNDLTSFDHNSIQSARKQFSQMIDDAYWNDMDYAVEAGLLSVTGIVKVTRVYNDISGRPFIQNNVEPLKSEVISDRKNFLMLHVAKAAQQIGKEAVKHGISELQFAIFPWRNTHPMDAGKYYFKIIAQDSKQ